MFIDTSSAPIAMPNRTITRPSATTDDTMPISGSAIAAEHGTGHDDRAGAEPGGQPAGQVARR